MAVLKLSSMNTPTKSTSLQAAKPTKPTADIRRPIDLTAFLVCVALSMIWGLQQTAIKAAATDFSPMLQVGVRSGVAALLLLLANRFWLHESWHCNIRPRDAILVGLGFVGEFLFVSEGLRFTSASHMSVLLYTAPFFAAIGLSIRLPEERLSPVQWLGLLVAFSGIAVAFALPAILAGTDTTGEGNLWLLGDFLGLLSGVSWGLTTIFLRTTTMNAAPASFMLFSQLGMAFVILTPLALLTGQNVVENTPIAWASMLFQCLIVSFASYLVWNMLLKRYLAARLGVLVFMTPFWGVFFSVLLLGDTIGSTFVIGSLLMLCGLFLVQARAFKLFKKRH